MAVYDHDPNEPSNPFILHEWYQNGPGVDAMNREREEFDWALERARNGDAMAVSQLRDAVRVLRRGVHRS